MKFFDHFKNCVINFKFFEYFFKKTIYFKNNSTFLNYLKKLA